MHIVLFGQPGSGKGTQAKLLVEKYDYFHFSTGEVLRKEITAQTDLGKRIEQIIKEGRLVPDDIVNSLFENAVANHSNIIFDGYPRNISQFENFIKKVDKQNVIVLALVVEESILVDRLIQRGRLENRCDDTPETIANRLKEYETQTRPVLDAFKTAGFNVFQIDGSKDINSINLTITNILEEFQRGRIPAGS